MKIFNICTRSLELNKMLLDKVFCLQLRKSVNTNAPVGNLWKNEFVPTNLLFFFLTFLYLSSSFHFLINSTSRFVFLF